MRYAYNGTFKDGQGSVVTDGTISVFLAGTSTAASVYTASSGGSAVNSVTSDSTDGDFIFYVDDADYGYTQRFKITLTKTNYRENSYDDVPVLPVVLVAASQKTYIKVSHTLAYGTDAGATTAAAWTLRPLNTEDSDVGGYASLATNQLTLAAGTYVCRITSVVYNSATARVKLKNVTDGDTELIGLGDYAGLVTASCTHCHAEGEFTIADTKVFEVYQWHNGNIANGLGRAMYNTGESEVYCTIELWKA